MPALHRAQVVVVGDRMQLPPTQYFAATRRRRRRATTLRRRATDGDEIGVVLDGDSFLAQSAAQPAGDDADLALPQPVRGADRFQQRGVLRRAAGDGPGPAPLPPAADVAPSRRRRPARRSDEAVAPGVDALLARSISFHRTDGAVYRRRANPGEAAYVAALVRELLRRETGLTIGVVAFSEAQQGEIERALERLAPTDDDFARRYEAELAREDGEQSVGLFVKNLENVQGDERDVIVMSVCYAPRANGRMMMNFGPINQRGGEKRLNVILSRARRHMAVVSRSIRRAITNVYNDGAATLRQFLTYAEAVSRGDAAAAARAATALAAAGVGGTRPADDGGRRRDVAARGGAAGARADVAERVGQSAFRCDLAVRRPGDDAYRVAVLVDTPARVSGQPVAERMLGHPTVLRAAGWRVVHVLTKDWLTTPDEVTASVESALPPPPPPEVVEAEPAVDKDDRDGESAG